MINLRRGEGISARTAQESRHHFEELRAKRGGASLSILAEALTGRWMLNYFERVAKTKRALKQVQNVPDWLHEEVSGQRVVRTTFRQDLSDWLMAKKAETASSTHGLLSDQSQEVCAVSRSAGG